MATIGNVTIRQPSRSTIVAQNFEPKPNVSLSEVGGIDITGAQNGDALIFNSTTGKYEANTITATVTQVSGGTF